jgi:two-component system sensor histidine kinase PilS (NtrC family)
VAFEDDLSQRVLRYILIRLVLVTLILAYALFLYLYDGFPEPLRLPNPKTAFTLALGGYALLLLATVAVRRVERPVFHAYGQILGDTLAVSALVWVFDGIRSPFAALFAAAVVGAAWLDQRRGALASAGLNSVILMGIGGVGLFQPDRSEAGEVLAVLLTEVFGLFLVAMLTGELGVKLRETGQALREEAARSDALAEDLQQIFRALRGGLALLAEDGTVRLANGPARELLPGLGQEPLAKLFPGAEDTVQAVWEIEGQGPSSDRTLLVIRSPTEGGGSVLAIEDVTELRDIQRRVDREERLSAVGRLSTGIAHEIRNPLTSLSGAVQLMDLSESDQRLREIVLREVDRLNRLVTDFMASAQPPRLQLADGSMTDVILEVAEAFSHDSRYAAVQLERDLPELGPVRLDSDQLKHVFWNLLLNAAQHMPEGGTIWLRAYAEGDWAVAEVEDDGVGIPPERLPKIFDPFYTARTGGTGLGLATVERVVREHEGSVAVRSQVGEGTVVVVRIPRRSVRG